MTLISEWNIYVFIVHTVLCGLKDRLAFTPFSNRRGILSLQFLFYFIYCLLCDESKTRDHSESNSRNELFQCQCQFFVAVWKHTTVLCNSPYLDVHHTLMRCYNVINHVFVALHCEKLFIRIQLLYAAVILGLSFIILLDYKIQPFIVHRLRTMCVIFFSVDSAFHWALQKILLHWINSTKIRLSWIRWGVLMGWNCADLHILPGVLRF